ncbi:UNVERIFIED_CONTAM: hypothetical protein BEN50_01730 [Euhalothece sp. KZN 001]
MPKDIESLIDIQQAGERVLKFSKHITYRELEANDEKVSAILYQITIIGEATKRLSPEFCQQHPEIPWRNLAAMRNIIVHEYDQVDFEVVWDVIQDKIPKLS